jgi:hypothetical protein
MTTTNTGSQLTALPDFYYFCFGAYEPFLTFIGLLGTFSYVNPLSLMNPYQITLNRFTVILYL